MTTLHQQGDFEYNSHDRDFWLRELDDFVPARIFDAHAHLWTEAGQEHMPPPPRGASLRMEVDLAALQAWSSQIFPGRACHYLLLATPNPGMDIAANNAWLSRQAAGDPESRCSMAVAPQMPPEQLEAMLKRNGCIGVKPYRSFAPAPADARIRDFLPESQMEVLHGLGKAVTLHLSLKLGPADPANLHDLRKYTARYPRIRWILAHCARAFNACLLEKSIHELKHIPNLWYDTSAVNDLYTHYLLLKHEDIRRIMFGSDNVLAGCAHGKYITYARAWRMYDGREPLEHCDARPVPVIYEQLLQQKRAAEMLELTAADIDRIFIGNAREFIPSAGDAGDRPDAMAAPHGI